MFPALSALAQINLQQRVPSSQMGDIWDGSASVNADTNLPIIFDARSSYAHDECKRLEVQGVDGSNRLIL